MSNLRVLPRRPDNSAADPFGSVPFAVCIDDSDSPRDVVDALALWPFASGEQPWATSVRLEGVRPDAPLRPPGARLLRTAVQDGLASHVAVGDGWTLRAVRWNDRYADVSVTAVRADLARTVLDQATRNAVAPKPPEDEAVDLGFWYRRDCGQRRVRSIAIQPWRSIRRNYAGPVAAAMDRLMALGGEGLSGRLLLLHGPPGTGKTTTLRALAHAWRDWCVVDCVLDPEHLFDDPGYLMDVVVGDDDASDRWRLLLLEDCDELIGADAKRSSGQALSRLLNLTDGLLGQSRRILVAITTNEELGRLHPAVVRPGRCLAQIEVGRLPRGEAAAWLGTSRGIGPDGASLAELYQLKGDLDQVQREEPPAAVGQYL